MWLRLSPPLLFLAIGPFLSDILVEFHFTGYDAFRNVGESGVMRVEIGPELRTIEGFDWISVFITLASWLSIRFYRHKPSPWLENRRGIVHSKAKDPVDLH
ncbi:MAG: hypothetical protein ACE5R6_10495 [Candidatus Heimdallarchaeota archaeon]